MNEKRPLGFPHPDDDCGVEHVKRAKENSLEGSEERGFSEVVRLIEASRHHALQAYMLEFLGLPAGHAEDDYAGPRHGQF